MKVKAIYDNGGSSMDRYTVVFDGVPYRGMLPSLSLSAYALQANGVCMHGQAFTGRGHKLGKRIKFEYMSEEAQVATARVLAEEEGA